MLINAERHGRWKLMLTPPLRDMDWRIRILRTKGRALQALQRTDKDKDFRVFWSRSFARAMRDLPPLFAEATEFKVRAIPEEKQVVYYFERTESVAAWIAFKVDLSGKLMPLDSGS